MSIGRNSKFALTALSVPVLVALILNSFVQPVHASFESGRLTPCPNSVLAIGNEKIGDLLEHLEGAGEHSAFSSVLRGGTQKEGNEGQETATHGQEDTNKSQKPSVGTDQSAVETGVVGSESVGVETKSGDDQEQTGLLGTVRDYWRQIRELRLEMPDLSLLEARNAWDQMLNLLKEMPELSVGEAKEVWREIGAIRLEMPDLDFDQARKAWDQVNDLRVDMPALTFEEAQEVWGQIRELQFAFPDLSFDEAQRVWDQIRALRVEIPDLSLKEAKEIWEQIRELEVDVPDLSFEEAREAWDQIGDLRVRMPDLGFEEAKGIWQQILELRIESPELSFDEATEAWHRIGDLRAEMPDLGFEELKEIWEQIRDLQIESPDLSFDEAREAWDQVGELRVDMPDLSLSEAKKIWYQIHAVRVDMPDLGFGEGREIWEQIRDLQVEIPELSFDEAREVWSLIGELRPEMPELGREEAKEIWEQIRDLQISIPDLSFDEAREAWGQISELQAYVPSLSLEQAKELWFELQGLRAELPELTFEEARLLWLQVLELKDTLAGLDGIPDPIVDRAESLLLALGFEDSDGDGHLNWPEGTPLEGQDVDLEIFITDSAGIAIGLVPVVGDTVDGVAFLIGRDPYSGECLTQTEQILVALAIIPFLPLSVKGVKVGGKLGTPLARIFTLRLLPTLPLPVVQRLVSGLVHPFFRGMRTIAGEGATKADELASSLDLVTFTGSNYRRSLIKFTGISEKAAKGLEAHHILPREFEDRFLEHGIETIHDPRLLVWVDPDMHKGWSKAYGDAWVDFFEQTPNPTRLQILEEAGELAEEFDYEVLFEIAG